MRTIIGGSRGIADYALAESTILAAPWVPTVVLCGTARGADQLGLTWAIKHNVPFEQWPANWDRYGKLAGFIRNTQMANNAEALIALWDGASRGTLHMIKTATDLGLKIFVKTL